MHHLIFYFKVQLRNDSQKERTVEGSEARGIFIHLKAGVSSTNQMLICNQMLILFSRFQDLAGLYNRGKYLKQHPMSL